MELPESLRRALDDALDGMPAERLAGDARALSERYRAQRGDGARLATGNEHALAYAAARMPATYAAIHSALRESLAAMDALGSPTPQSGPVSLLDAGAGTGAACWAADALLHLREITCLEREPAMRALGARLMMDASPALRAARWMPYDLCDAHRSGAPMPGADIVIAAYVLNEIAAEHRPAVVRALWEATGGLLLLVEPGTPVGFANLSALREALAAEGAHGIAPCPQTDRPSCPIRPPDWCHFACRVARSRIHRLVKGGDAPYEDEKYAYLAFAREKPPHALPHSLPNEGKQEGKRARVLRHPQIRNGFVELSLCTDTGIRQVTLSKRDGEAYKRARKARAGDALSF
ncbi:MAG: small ribosomal subunit Rsm22 family protein [Clostridia bacterium]|nr:small ribosomal subunit Rsm22 family protein [Clostridia bacterium]